MISFVSEAWGGLVSNKFVTENCGFLVKLLPGDMVMADRGFTISVRVGLKQARLVIQAFTKGKSQLDPVDVDQTRGIANVRIHVEHVIGLLRWKFTILEGTLRTDYLMSHHETLITTLHWWITWQEFVQLLLTSVLLLYHLIRQTSFETLEIEISLSPSPLEESDEEQYLVRVVAEWKVAPLLHSEHFQVVW